MDGKVPYTDARVKDVFAKWKQLIDAGFFLPNNSNYSWQESVPFIMKGKAAMILIGNFFTQTISDDMKDKFIQGVLGARLTGGGFGGSTIWLVEREKAQEILSNVSEVYRQKTGATCKALITKASQGARLLERN